MIAILVNGIELDITEDTRNSLTISVGLSEAGDVLKRSPEFAPSITVPASAKNNAIFGYLNENGVKTGNVWLPCEIYNYPDLILKGNIQVNSYNGDSYNCSCFSSQLDVINILKNTKLSDLDGWEDLDHLYDNTPISERIEPTQELLYLRADNGLYRNSSQLAMAPIDLKPAISLQAVIDRMNDTLPFSTDVTAIPNRATTMLVNGKVIKYDEEYINTELTNTATLNNSSDNEYEVEHTFALTDANPIQSYTVLPPNRLTANADSPINNNIYYNNNQQIAVVRTQKVNIKLNYILTALITVTGSVPISSGFLTTRPVVNVRSLAGSTIYTAELGEISVNSNAGASNLFSSTFTNEFEIEIQAGNYFIDINFTSLVFSAAYGDGQGPTATVTVNTLFKLLPAFDQQFAIFEGGSLIPRSGLMRAKNVLPDLTCFDVIQHLVYLYGCAIDITRNSLGTATGIKLNRYSGKEALPFQGLIDFSSLPIQEYGVQSFKQDNIVTYKPDEADPTSNSGALTTFTCQHTQPNSSRDWYVSPFAWTNTKLTFTNQREIASIPNYVLPFGSRYVVGGVNSMLLQVNDYFAQGWVLYKVLQNCTVGTLFDNTDNYEVASYSDLGERDLVDRFVRVLTVPSIALLLTDGLFSPVTQELKYNAVAISQNKEAYSDFLKAIERNRQIEVQAYLTLSEFKYLSTQIQSGNRFTIPELGCDVYLQKIENYAPAVYGKCKITFLAT